MKLEDFYSGKRVLVTGGAGFIGSYLVYLLSGLGVSQVTVMDDFSRGKKEIDGVTYYPKGDVTKHNHTRIAFETQDIVFNLAATVAGVLYNTNHHHEMFLSNVEVQTIPVAIAEAVGVEHFLQVSSVCVYAPEYLDPAEERNGHKGEPHPANWGYAWAKRMGERMVESCKIPHAVIVRPSNVFGSGDYYDNRAHVIPALIKRSYEDGPLVVYGSPNIKREFIHAMDVAEGMIHAMAFGEDKEAYNIGTGGETQITLNNLVGLILQATGFLDKEVIFDESRGGGDPVRRSDARKTQDVTGWKYKMGLRKGIVEQVRFYEIARNNKR